MVVLLPCCSRFFAVVLYDFCILYPFAFVSFLSKVSFGECVSLCVGFVSKANKQYYSHFIERLWSSTLLHLLGLLGSPCTILADTFRISVQNTIAYCFLIHV